jgi:hypothetical protein
MSDKTVCEECGYEINEHYHCQKVTAERLRLVQEELTNARSMVETGHLYVTVLEGALAKMLTQCGELFEVYLPLVEEHMPELKPTMMKAIADIKKVVSDHEGEKGQKNETVN